VIVALPLKSYSVRYGFSQPFRVPAEDAYRWCTDYKTDDLERMGMKGSRKIRRINQDTLIITDSVIGKGKTITKEKLVRLNPEKTSWTNTYLAGPNRLSQFLYSVVAEGKDSSRLHFTGLQVFYGNEPSSEEISGIAKRLVEEDSGSWARLAESMRKDIG
jgi:hypothetical protein